MADEEENKKKKKCPPEGAADWLQTYGDMTTLLLTFFVILIASGEVEETRMELILASFTGLGPLAGGNTLEVGDLAELGNAVMTMPSMSKGRGLDEARQTAVSVFQPEIKSEMIRVKEDERGLIISLAGDAFFKRASAEVDMERARETLQKLSRILSSEALKDNIFRLEGHTDSMPTDPEGEWPTNWELSTERATNVLHYLVDFGVREEQFQVAGFADTVPLADNDTPEGRAYNRRVDVVILTEGHL